MITAAVRKALIDKQRLGQYASQSRSKLTSVPSPTGGLNTIAALANMPPTDAVSMTNMFPGYGTVDVRKGTAQRYLGIGSGDVLTIAEYFSGTNRKMLGASQTNIYDAAKSPSYTVNSVKFDGSSGYLNSAGLTSIVDSKVGSISVWIRLDSSSQQFIFTIGSGPKFEILFNAGKFVVAAQNSAGTFILNIQTTLTYSTGSTWYNILASWNLATATTNLYINGVSDKSVVTATNDTINYSNVTLNTFVGKSNAGGFFGGAISELWFDPTSCVDFTSGTNRAKFIDSNGFPVSLGSDGSTPTGSAPILYLKGSYIDFGTNSGTGGNFTINGSLTAASTSPTSTAISLLGSQTSGRWQTSNFMTNMLWVNGQDAPQVFGGSTFTSWTGSASGMTTTSVIGCNVYKNRMWVWMGNDTNVFYSATQTIGGTYVKFPLGDVGNFGGNLTAMATLSHDGGNGPQDYAVFFFSSGDTIVYSGDPASTFTLVGIYKIPPPIGIRSVRKFGGDILIQTAIDYVLFSQVLSGVYKNPSKISGQLQTDSAAYILNSGWQLVYWPEGGMIIGNVPVSSTEFQQHVMNVTTGAWCVYNDINARCWGMYNGNLYFGAGDGSIYQAETGNDDNGASISADCQQAWNSAGYGGNKKITNYRPVMTAVGDLTYSSGIAYDFATVNVSQTASTASVGAAWDTSDWDTTSWSPETQLKQTWNGSKGLGYLVGLRLRLDTTQAVSWFRTDFLSVPAGPI